MNTIHTQPAAKYWLTGLVLVAAVTLQSPVYAFSGILQAFESTYPASNSANNAGCQLCHGSSTSTWNEYGWGLRQNGENFGALEGLPSVNINGGTSMLDEINASTQPGWTTGASNNLYNSGGLSSSTQTPPGGIGTLDPAVSNVPPVADAGGPYSGTVGIAVQFDGSGSSDSDGSIAAYDWDFGDGNTGTGVNPIHAYSGAGTYTVTLTVTDDAGDSDTATAGAEIIAGNVPPSADANGPYNGTAGLPVSFDGSGSSDPDGSIVAYDWDFGDGNTGTGMSPTNTYAAAGTYTVTLVVTDDAGDTGTGTSTASIVDAPQDPVADPNGPYSGYEGQPVAFDGSGSFDPDGGSITAWDWDFGDGNTGTGESPMHAYSTAGTYTVTLTVVDDEGAQSVSVETSAIIDVPPSNLPPTADPNGPYTGTTGQPVSFDGSGSSDPDGTVAAWDWDFGDGNTGTGESPTHTYSLAGLYTVTLTVTDDAGEPGTPVETTATIDDVPTCVTTLEIDQAEWRASGGRLIVRGIQTKKCGPISVANANDPDPVLATRHSNGRRFSFNVKRPSPVPCRVLVEQDGVTAEADVMHAPADCDSTEGPGNGTPDCVTTLAITRAEWRDSNGKLSVRGENTKKCGPVSVTNAADQNQVLGVKNGNAPRFNINVKRPNTVPCAVQVEQDGVSVQADVMNAPADCNTPGSGGGGGHGGQDDHDGDDDDHDHDGDHDGDDDR